MKKTVVALFTLFLVCSTLVSEAQTLSKSEKKALKKEIKTYKKDPEKWVTLKKKHRTEVQELNDEIEALKAKLAAETAEKQELANTLAVLQEEYDELKKSMVTSELPMGTVYQVQMGYYQYLDLLSFNSKLKTVRAEEIDGSKRYVIGYFENVMDALQFSNDMKTLGIKDAFVSRYIDGKRDMTFDALKSIAK